VYETLGRDFLLLIWFSSVSVISPMFDTHLRLNIALIGRTSGRNLGNMKQSTIILEHWTATHYHIALYIYSEKKNSFAPSKNRASRTFGQARTCLSYSVSTGEEFATETVR
jgi:hypothetical protein